MTYKLLKDKTILVTGSVEFIGSYPSGELFFKVISSIGILTTNFEERKNATSLFFKLVVNNINSLTINIKFNNY
jgi:hypothetical protein